MEKGHGNLTTRIAVIGGIIVAAILILGTVWMVRSARNDTETAAEKVSLLYLDELAGRREQVVEDKLNDHIDTIRVTVSLMTEEDLSDPEHLQAYQSRMKRLYDLEKFAFVDTDGLIYTALGMQTNIDDYQFDHTGLTEPEISIVHHGSEDSEVVIAVPTDIRFNGKDLKVCFMEIDMQVMLESISMVTQNSEATYCNIYTSEGIPLSNAVLGGMADESNLLEALSHAEFQEGYSLEQVTADFGQGKGGIVSFSYNDTREMLCYTPVKGTDWLLTYLISASVISNQIRPVTDGPITRSHSHHRADGQRL